MAMPAEDLPIKKKKPLKRFTREEERKPELIIQPRDIEIITAVHEYRLLNSWLLQALFPTSERVVLLRLQKLFHHGYLDRLKGPVSNPIVYALGNRGADVISELYCLERDKINWQKKNKEVKDFYMLHTLQIASFRTILTLALRQKPQTKIVSWYKDGEIKDEVIYEHSKKKIRGPVVPDAFFTLEDQNEKMHFFLEADRSTMTNQRFFNKMQAYWHYWKKGLHKENLSIESFRVLTVCKSEERKENLRAITKNVDEQKTGTNMFWFASEEKYSLKSPETILGSIWQTPKSDTLHHLLE